MANRTLEQSVEIFIENHYTVKDRDEVFAFLRENSSLGDLLIEEHGHIRQYFPTSSYHLELYSDPEFDHDALVVLIETELTVDEAMNKLELFDQNCWLDNIEKAATKLHFNLAYL